MDRAEIDILGGYLTLLSRNNYLYVYATEHCLREVKAKTYDSGEAFPVSRCVGKLKENIAAMKKHIEMAEQFLDDIGSNGEALE